MKLGFVFVPIFVFSYPNLDNSLEKAFDITEKHLSNSPEILKKDFYASLKASFTVDEVNQQLIDAGLSQLEVFQVDELYFEIIGCT